MAAQRSLAGVALTTTLDDCDFHPGRRLQTLVDLLSWWPIAPVTDEAAAIGVNDTEWKQMRRGQRAIIFHSF
jgi:hypothetical protein